MPGMIYARHKKAARVFLKFGSGNDVSDLYNSLPYRFFFVRFKYSGAASLLTTAI